VIDLIRAKPLSKELKNILSKYKSIITIDEQTSVGSLESLVQENISSKQNILPMSLPDQFIFENMGRDKLLDKYGLSIAKIKKNISKIIKS
jgi:deoxyxylulose-5-phosphate synthase